MQILTSFRCKNCNKPLAKGKGHIEIKCPRCKKINQFKNVIERPKKGKIDGTTKKNNHKV